MTVGASAVGWLARAARPASATRLAAAAVALLGPATLGAALLGAVGLGAGVVALRPSTASAQAIRGRVLDRETGEPVRTALVRALDADGVRLDGVLTDPEGRFRHQLPGAGRYWLRVERIGFRTTVSGPVEVGSGAEVSVRLTVEGEAIQLAPIRVAGEQRCRIPEQEGVLMSDVWEEARKALELAIRTREQPWLHVRIREHVRTLDVLTLDVLDERSRTISGFTHNPFRARPADELARAGYVRRESDGTHSYFGLAPETLLSPAFEDTHCFRLRPPEPDQDPGEIGLAFEPAPGHGPPDVAGVLWLDRATAVLKRVEYTYTRDLNPVELPRAPFGGRTEFRQLPNGAVIVDRWWIRMPQFARELRASELPRPPSGGAGVQGERERLDAFRRLGLSVLEVGAALASVAMPGQVMPLARPD